MIYINKGQRNVIGLTLTETSRVSSPYYLFVFTSDGAKIQEEVIFVAPDVSGYPERLNIFELVEGSTGSKTFANAHEGLEEGEAHLSLQRGQYTYKVYESETLVTEVALTTGNVVEVGRMVVELSEDEEDKGQNNNERSIYE